MTDASNHGRRWPLLLLVLVLLLVGGAWLLRRPIPRVTRAEWEVARRRWNERRPDSYRVQIRVTGRQGARYDVTVRDGQVTRALRNGQVLSEGRSQATWTIDGMFETIAYDVEGQSREAARATTPTTPSLLLRCRFHPEWGYPDEYQRIEWGTGSTNPDVTWKVDLFEPG